MRRTVLLLMGLVIVLAAPAGASTRILFVGNSFTYGHGSAVHFYRADTVTDLNGEGIGGVPALFKSFTVQAGLDYEVSLETHPGIGIDWHVEHAACAIGARSWDLVMLQTHSLLDVKKPGDAHVLTASVQEMLRVLRAKSPQAEVRLTATWPRADQVYPATGAWAGKSVELMARDLRAGSDAARAANPVGSDGRGPGGVGGGVIGVVGVGEAWVRAMHTGVADANPYDGIEAGKLDLWTYDHYHASTAGYYLEALMIFGSVTGLDPASLGATECSGFELGLSTEQVTALQKVAADELGAQGVALRPARIARGVVANISAASPSGAAPTRCAAGRR